MEENHEAAFQHLSQKVTSANLGASSLEPRSWGHLLVGDILGFSTTALPSEQLDRASMRAPQPRADALLFAAARALHQCHQKDLDDFWHFSGHRLARLWRMLMSRNMRSHPRTQVVPDRAKGVQGECIGISQSQARRAYCTKASPADVELLSLIRSTLPPKFRDFGFSTAQLNRELRPKLHRDSANLGSSLTIALGPYVGGGLWQSQGPHPTDFKRDCVHYAPWKWVAMNGSQLHAVYPYFGNRCSVVLCMHDAVMRPLPADVRAQASALGLATCVGADTAALVPAARVYEHFADWPLLNALDETAEATLHVANTSYESLRGFVREDSSLCAPDAAPPAAHVLPQRVLALLLLACQAVQSRPQQAPRTHFGLSPDADAFFPLPDLPACCQRPLAQTFLCPPDVMTYSGAAPDAVLYSGACLDAEQGSPGFGDGGIGACAAVHGALLVRQSSHKCFGLSSAAPPLEPNPDFVSYDGGAPWIATLQDAQTPRCEALCWDLCASAAAEQGSPGLTTSRGGSSRDLACGVFCSGGVNV